MIAMSNVIKSLRNSALFLVCIQCWTSICAQNVDELAPTQWREDLKYLQNLVHTKYRNLFHNVTEKQFDSAIAAAEKKIGTVGDVQMRVEIAKSVAMFKVGHTTVRQHLGAPNQQYAMVH